MGWGVGIGIGEGLQSEAANLRENLKTSLMESWRQKEKTEDRQFQINQSKQEQRQADARLDRELQFKEEQNRLDRESSERVASMRGSKTSDHKVGRYKSVTSEAGEVQILDTATGQFVSPSNSDQFDPDAFVEKYQQAKGDQSPGAQASSEKKTLASQYQNKADLLETEKTSGKQIEYYDSQLSNIEARVGELSNLSLPDNDGLFEVNSAGSGDQNAKKHFMRMLEDIYKNGSPEQQEKAHSLYRQLMGA